jgi:hypothetical protein
MVIAGIFHARIIILFSVVRKIAFPLVHLRGGVHRTVKNRLSGKLPEKFYFFFRFFLKTLHRK